MDKFEFTLDEKAIKNSKLLLSNMPKESNKAISRAINRTLSAMRTEANRAIRENFNVKASKVNQTFKIKKSTNIDLNGALISRGTSLPLGAFKIKPYHDTTGKKRRKVLVNIQKNKTQTFERSFVFNKQIFQRIGKKRLPIKILYGPAVPQMLKNEKVTNNITNKGTEIFENRLIHETQAILKGYVKDAK